MSDRKEPAGRSMQGLLGNSQLAAMTHRLGGGDLTADLWPRGTLDSGDPAVHCSLRTPTPYEPGYAYPLIVWFHEYGNDERQLLSVLPHISERNYAGLGVRGPLPVSDGLPQQRRWSLGETHLRLVEDELAVCLRHAAEHINICWERVVVAGIGQGATLALKLLIRRPEWFAGAACLDAEWRPDTVLECWGRYSGKPLWLGHVCGWSAESPRAAVRHARLLQTAGFDVTVRTFGFDDADPRTIGLDVDRWLLGSLCPKSVVQ